MKYEDFRDFAVARIEQETASIARRPSLVPVDAIARLGALTFGPGFEKHRAAVEHVARNAAAKALGLQPPFNLEADLDVERCLTSETAQALRRFAESHATLIVTREAKVHERNGNGAASSERYAAVHYVGVWEAGTHFRGAMTTDHGTLWFCEAESTIDRPGTSPAWRLMVKNKERHR